jgi:hypothetical protein
VKQPSTTSSISKGSSSWDVCGGESGRGSCSGGTFWGTNWLVDQRPVLLRAVRRVWDIYHWNKKSVRYFFWTSEIRDKGKIVFETYMSLRASGLARLAPDGQHSSDTTCRTPFWESGNETSIRVPRMFKSHVQQQYDKQVSCSII